MTPFDDYLAPLAEPERAALERVRRFVHRTVPDAVEATSYGLPAFKHDGRPLLGFRASKHHLSVVPFSAEAVEAARDALEGFDVTKGTVRFTPDRPIPERALKLLLDYRLGEIGGSAKA